MIDPIKKEAEMRMKKCVEALQYELSKLRTGRAHPSILEHVMVSYYGNDTPLVQIASITISDSRTLMVTPWEKNILPNVEKALKMADLGLNPATAGTSIRVPLPVLTEERRKEMIKLVRNEGENSKITIRNIRRDANSNFKDLLKKKSINEDDDRSGQEAIQKLTDNNINEIDKLLAVKEKELMTV
jgi:ribosome recycling factor